MNILITGICGFIGHHLERSLTADGHSIFGIDNLASGDPERLLSTTKFRELDCTSHGAYQNLPPLDRIYHLACPASPPKYQADPVRTLNTCYLGTLAALTCAKNHKARLLFASTSEVYGDPEVHPQPEEYTGSVNTIGPRACYDEGKRVAETLCSEYANKYGVEVRIARIFNTYGPGMSPDDGRVITNFISQAKANQPLTIYGTGRQTRSFCYVDDTVRGLKLLMESDVDTPVNIGNPGEFTILELAYAVFLALNPSSLWPMDDCAIEYLPGQQHDPKQRCPDITKAMSLLGWCPSVSLQEGLERMVG